MKLEKVGKKWRRQNYECTVDNTVLGEMVEDLLDIHREFERASKQKQGKKKLKKIVWYFRSNFQSEIWLSGKRMRQL